MWAVVLAAVVGARAGNSFAPPVQIEERPLGSAAAYDALKAITFSPDSQHVAFLGVKGDKQYVVLDGIEGAPFDWVIPDSLDVPINPLRLPFIVQNGNEMAVVIDGKVIGKGYYFIGGDRVRLSLDGKHYAFTARRSDGGVFVVHDGVEGKKYSDATAVPQFSPDGGHLAYECRLSTGRMSLVLDGTEQRPYDSIVAGTPTFSPDSKRLAYAAVQERKFVAVIDGKGSKPYQAMLLTPVFSPDSKRVAYIVGSDGQALAVIDGQDGPKYDGFPNTGALAFSPDSKHVAYAARKGKQCFVIRDGKEEGPFDDVFGGTIRFSPDSTHLSYVAASASDRFVVRDGKPGPIFDGIVWPGAIFSPDSQRLAYAAVRGHNAVVVADGVASGRYSSIIDVAFSPDSKHLAYRALSDQRPVVAIDGHEITSYDSMTAVSFSPDGKHDAFIAAKGPNAVIVVDGTEIGKIYTNWVRGSRAVFATPDTVDAPMVRGRDFFDVRIKIAPASAAPTQAPVR